MEYYVHQTFDFIKLKYTTNYQISGKCECFFSQEYIKPSRPTLILQQLCLALLGYLIMLYVSEFLVDTKTGCIAVNILRYYFVMVSLLWNGLEGLNMYLMLVKVFKSNIRYFMVKATILAWGK